TVLGRLDYVVVGREEEQPRIGVRGGGDPADRRHRAVGPTGQERPEDLVPVGPCRGRGRPVQRDGGVDRGGTRPVGGGEAGRGGEGGRRVAGRSAGRRIERGPRKRGRCRHQGGRDHGADEPPPGPH